MHKMEVIVKDYGDSEVKERYRVDQHIALTDAWCLTKLCISQSDLCCVKNVKHCAFSSVEEEHRRELFELKKRNISCQRMSKDQVTNQGENLC